MKTSEYMDKEISGLTRSRSDDFSSYGIIGGDYDYEESLSPRFGFYSSHPQGSAYTGEVRSSFNEALLSLIDKRMKEQTDEVLHAVEGVSARLTQLENRARRMENAIDDLKEYLNSHHGKTDGKLREFENLLREVQNCTKDLRDKQDIAGAQIQLAKLAMSRAELHLKKPEATARTEPIQEAPPLVPQKSTQSLNNPVAPSQQTSTPTPQVSSHFPQPIPLPTPQVPPVLHTFSQPEALYQIPPALQPVSTPEQPHHLPYQPPTMPLPPMHQLHQPPFVAAVPPPTQQVSSGGQLQPSEFSHYSPRASMEGTHIPSNSPFTGPPFQLFDSPYSKSPEQPTNIPYTDFQQFDRPYWEPPEQPTSGPYSDFTPHQRLESNFDSLYAAHGRGGYTPFHSNSTRESLNPLQSTISSGYLQLPTAQMLPQALPTVSIRDPEPSSDSSGSREPMNDVVDRVVAMGFQRDVVRAMVKRLTDRGQPVDLNVVLDMLTNDGHNRTPNARFG